MENYFQKMKCRLQIRKNIEIKKYDKRDDYQLIVAAKEKEGGGNKAAFDNYELPEEPGNIEE